MCRSNQESIIGLGLAPVSLSTNSPFLKSSKAGIPLTPNLPALSGFTSVFTFAIVISLSSDICLSTGPIILQGPHHGAQKSTRTHSSLLVTTSKSASLVEELGEKSLRLYSSETQLVRLIPKKHTTKLKNFCREKKYVGNQLKHA